MPSEMAAWDADRLAGDSPYQFIGGEFYHLEGKPVICPVLAFDTVFEALEHVFDRAAVNRDEA